MARASLTALIRRVRLLINDPEGPDQVFSADAIADALDTHRQEQRWVPLVPRPTFSPGTISYLDFYSAEAPWEADVVLQRSDYTDVTLDVTLFEPLVGHFAFATEPLGQAVRATGKTFDEYAAAGDLLTAWASKVALQFTFGSERQTFNRREQHAMLLESAQRMYALARPRSGRLVQRDAAPEALFGGGPAITWPTTSDSGLP